MDKELRKWKRVSVALVLALVFSAYVCYRQNVVIRKQREVMVLLYTDLLKVAHIAEQCIAQETIQ